MAALALAALLAGAPLVGCQPAAENDEVPETEVDVVIAGGGAAGMAAAVEAARAGADVLVVERLPMLGGSALVSGGFIYGAETPAQERAGIADSAEELAGYWYFQAEGLANEDLVKEVAEQSGATLSWLEDLGVEFAEPEPAGMSPVPRSHRPQEDGGVALVRALERELEELGVEVWLETRAVELLEDNSGRVIGLEAETGDDEKVKVTADAVVLATGGFASDPDLVAEFAPEAEDHITYSRVSNTGDGLRMAREAGADIVAHGGMIGFRGVADNIPYILPLGGLALAPCLFVDSQGQPLEDVVISPSHAYEKMAERDEDYFLIFDAQEYTDILEEGIEKQVVSTSDDLTGLAREAGIDPLGLAETVEEFNEQLAAGQRPACGADPEEMQPVEEPPFFALQVQPATLGSMGGPRIGLDTAVLDGEGEPIPGLYAAGELANGEFMGRVYPATGTALQFAFATGRIAGEQAADLSR